MLSHNVGINLDTELGYIFKRGKSGSLELDDSPPKALKEAIEADGYVFKKV
jgi:hypothetical protein